MSGKPGKISYIEIYALNRKPSSGCEFFGVEERHGVFVARCGLTERYIVNTNVHKCETLWEHCPYRRLYIQTLGDQVRREKKGES